jgi:Ca2+-binding RTX toxin-like protein
MKGSTTAITTNRTIIGDLAPLDFDLATAGVQTRLDDLDNIIVNSNQAEPGRGDVLTGSTGNDLILGLGGDDRLDGGAGDDVLNDAQGRLDGIADERGGNDILTSTYGGEMDSVTYTGIGAQDTKGDDIILAGAGADWVYGEYGNDYIDGGAGDDVLLGGDGNDALFGDDFTMEASSYTIASTAHGRDTLDGGDSDDQLTDGIGSDALYGDAGVDVLIGGDHTALFDHSYSVRLQDGTALRLTTNSIAACAFYSGATGRFYCQKLCIKTKRQSLKCGLKPQTGKTSHARSMRIAGHKWLGMRMECARAVSFGHALRSITNRGPLCVA